MSIPNGRMANRSWDIALAREKERQRRHREGGQVTELSDRLMDPTAGAPGAEVYKYLWHSVYPYYISPWYTKRMDADDESLHVHVEGDNVVVFYQLPSQP